MLVSVEFWYGLKNFLVFVEKSSEKIPSDAFYNDPTIQVFNNNRGRSAYE